MIQRECRGEVGDCRGVSEQPECIRCVGRDHCIPISKQGAKAGRARNPGLGAHLSDRQRRSRAHRSPGAGERAVNESRVEAPGVCHRQKLGV
jgi:hypothetical protein